MELCLQSPTQRHYRVVNTGSFNFTCINTITRDIYYLCSILVIFKSVFSITCKVALVRSCSLRKTVLFRNVFNHLRSYTVLFHACENTYLMVEGGFFFTTNFGDMYERMEINLRPFLRVTLWDLERIDLFQALPAIPHDEWTLSICWLKGHVDTRASYMFVPPFVIEDGSPFIYAPFNELLACSVSLILYVGRFHSYYRPRSSLG